MTTDIEHMEIINVYERVTHYLAGVAVQKNRVFEMINVEIDKAEFEMMRSGKMTKTEKLQIAKRALTHYT